MKRQNIAVIGGGAAGTTAAWLLSPHHDVTLFEAGSYLGGHAYSHPVTTNQGTVSIDMGVEYFNERLSPNLCAFLDMFGLESYVAPLTMHVQFPGTDAFWNTVSHEGRLRTDLEPEFDRFHKDMATVLQSWDPRHKKMSVGAYLDEQGYSKAFKYQALQPLMTVYSGCHGNSLDYTLMYVAFSFNMSLLSFFSSGYWRKVKGGIGRYYDVLGQALGKRVHLNAPVEQVTPQGDQTCVTCNGELFTFDHVIFATHGDQALALLRTSDPEYGNILGGFEYVPVTSILHQDKNVLNSAGVGCYCQFTMPETVNSAQPEKQFGDLTRVNNLLASYRQVDRPLLVTFDPKRPIAASHILHEKHWKLPKLRPIDFARKMQLRKIQGRNNLWFCGTDTSLTGHEGALVSAMVIADRLGAPYPFKKNTLASIQFKVIKDIMGVRHGREHISSWIGDSLFSLGKSLSLHKEQSHKFIKDLIV